MPTPVTPPSLRTGFWSANLRTGTVHWDLASADMHGMPPGHSPSLREALGFIASADRAGLIAAALSAYEDNQLFDRVVGLVIAGGVTRRVRLIGGLGWDARGDEAELHGIIEELDPASATAESEEAERLRRLSVATLAHELGARLASVAMRASLIEDDDDADLVQMRWRAGRIRCATTQMQCILGAVERLNGSAPLLRGPVDVSTTARELFEGILEREPHHAKAIVDIQPGIAIEADEQQMKLLLGHLLSNALKFSAGRADPRVSITATHEASRTLVHVTDNGIGIPPNQVARAFDLFTRLNEGFAGSGIGLALAKRIIERHGGLIWAHGEPGRGTTISFYT